MKVQSCPILHNQHRHDLKRGLAPRNHATIPNYMLKSIPGGEGEGGGKGLGEGGGLTAGKASKHDEQYILTCCFGPEHQMHFVLHRNV